MTHQRKTIRDAVKAIIEGAEIVPIGNVFLGRYAGFSDADLPAINIFGADQEEEASEPLEEPTGLQRRDYPLTIEVVFQNTNEEDLEDQGDAYAALIEAAMKADRSLGTTIVGNSWLQATAREATAEAETPTASILLTYMTRYYA